MGKHTPGPWIATGYKQTIVNDSRGNTIAMYPTGDGTTETAQANARLIAAAPELLEALEVLLSYANRYSDTMREIGHGAEQLGEGADSSSIAAQARRAIAKATGVQS